MPSPHESAPTEAQGSFPFIVATGCHGVGKSTVAQALSEHFGAATLQFPAEFIRFRERVGLDTGLGPRAQLLYYLGAAFQISDGARRHGSDCPVVSDRYVESPLALVQAVRAIEPDELDRICAPLLPRLRAPDLTLLLTARHEAAVDRIQSRGEGLSSTQRRSVASPDFYYACEAALRETSAQLGPMQVLDTTTLSVEAMCEAAIAAASEVISDAAGSAGPGAPA